MSPRRPNVVGVPATSTFSLTENGTPASGPSPSGPPGASTRVKAFSRGFSAAITARCASTTSPGLRSRSATERASSAALSILARLQRMDLSEHAKVNQAAWNVSAAEYAAAAQRNWGTDEISWGIWNVPETEVGALPDVAGMDVVELGCGTAYVSAWLARRGARPIGIDLSENQLATARMMQAEHQLEFPLVHASAENVPLSAESADLVISEYGAGLWCDPDLWLREASRLLRADGWLVFLTNSLIVTL